MAEVARSIGVHEMTLGKWVKKAKDSGQLPITKRYVPYATYKLEVRGGQAWGGRIRSASDPASSSGMFPILLTPI
ncbi:transposase [Pseudonocardia sp. TRM90224]|uniref:transposase n=1 Tax=Pseudonocardia sp. TRM90224 TaxID=2812678 RepID=UPI0035A97C1F